jgi:hypothetical protein
MQENKPRVRDLNDCEEYGKTPPPTTNHHQPPLERCSNVLGHGGQQGRAPCLKISKIEKTLVMIILAIVFKHKLKM